MMNTFTFNILCTFCWQYICTIYYFLSNVLNVGLLLIINFDIVTFLCKVFEDYFHENKHAQKYILSFVGVDKITGTAGMQTITHWTFL